MTRSTYAQTTEAKIRFGRLELHFLRSMATLHGVALSEMVRRFVADAMMRYSERGLYTMDPGVDVAPPEPAVSIRVVRGEDGSLTVKYSRDLSAAARRDLRDTLNRHVKELDGLVVSPSNGKMGQGEGEGRKEAGATK